MDVETTDGPRQFDDALELQVKVSKMLALGFVFSIVWVGGLGSFVALILGLRARKIIRQSQGRITGGALAWWCIIVGALGILILPPAIIWIIMQHN